MLRPVDPLTIIVVGAVFAGAVLFGSWYLSANERLRREIRNAPKKRIGDVREGETVRISGVVRAVDEPLRTPLTGRPCVAWRVLVQKEESSGNSRRWVTLLDERDSRSFELEDGGDVASIDGVALSLLLEMDRRGQKGLLSALPPELETFCHSRGIDTTGFLGFQKNLRYREGALEPGELATVVGVGAWVRDPSRVGGGYRDVGRRLHMSSLPDGRVLCSDDPDVAR